MPDIVMYASESCPYCRRARALLDRKGAAYTVLDVNRDPRLWPEMSGRTGRDTVPQIFIGDQHIGGCDDLFALDQRGGLEPLLKNP
ncbi:MAG: glutaredoxin 3 [Candidatus Competibacteraceae bacterium]|uniref:Glutaredoxin n=1 Tax=Candidatus Contendobacter odensis Run_B_J11 TaxID=1400861 RepID=A0A7U7J646_9GAMM|nr:glutaredoxin 3 [Candidatus Contendobacter odensis]MBK8536239.1 glutaredoxin 3 [Candidatus Competibacteraceae bacterium]MBK8751374.1 glutaredoxin 3 [Candidatus Competibacteraceae bacterium]CDH47348.1 glutaredoxin 3 [Candidatus Contendobacter odensis Run_B_J11]